MRPDAAAGQDGHAHTAPPETACPAQSEEHTSNSTNRGQWK